MNRRHGNGVNAFQMLSSITMALNGRCKVSNVKPKREWKIKVGAIMRNEGWPGHSGICIAVIGENIARHSADHKPHHCWIGIDYSSGKVYDVYTAKARPYQDGDWRFVYCKDSRTPAMVIAVEHGQKNKLWHCNIISEVTLPL